MTKTSASRGVGRWAVLGRFFGSLVVLAVIVVGVPALLVACSRAGLDAAHPFPGVGSSEEIRGYLNRGLSNTEVTPILMRSLLIVAWLLWLAMVLSILAAVIEAFRGRRVGLPQFAMFAGLGRWIAAGLATVTAAAPSFASASLPSPRPFVITNLTNAATTSGTASAVAPLRPGCGRVLPGESIETFAQRNLGDAARWREIWDLNANQPVGPDGDAWTAAWKLSAGWDLLLPTSNIISTEASATMPSGPMVAPSLAQIVASRPSPAPSLRGAGERAVDQHRVEAGDTYWSIAEVTLGDGASAEAVYRYTTALMEFNAPLLRYPDPAMLHPGDIVAIIPPPPAAADVPVDQPADQLADVGVSASTPGDDMPVHVVETGDSYWEIAEDTLGGDAAPAEVAQLTSDLIDLNSPMLGYEDRRMIHPGDLVYLHDPATDNSAPPTDEQPDDTTDPVAAAVPLPTTAATPPTTSTPAETAPTAPPSPTLPASSPETVVGGAASDTSRTGSRHAVLAGVTGMLALATGLGVRIVWLRRRRATRSARHTHLAATDLEQAVLAAADVPLVRWASQQLAHLIRDVDRRQLSAAPVAVELSEEAGIEVLWDQPQHAPTPPDWISADGGWAWRHTYDPDAPVPAGELPAGIPGLVTIGRRDGRQLLVDLEAFGTLTVTGPDDRVEGFVRSVAVELAVGDDLADAYVTTINLSTALDGRLDRLSLGDLDTTAQRLITACRSVRDTLDRAGITDTFRARAGSTTPLEAVVAVAARADADGVALLAAAVEPRCGVAVVVATDSPLPGAAQVELHDDGSAHLEPLGVTFQPVALPLDTTVRIGDTLAALADLDDDPTGGGPVPNSDGYEGHGLFAPDPSFVTGIAGNGDGPPHDGPGELDGDVVELIDGDSPAKGWRSAVRGGVLFDLDPAVSGRPSPMMVRVLGVPSIPQRPDLGRRELILAVLLACRGGSLAATAAQDALWGGKPVESKTVWNFVAKTRAALGEFDDGCPVMPSADRTRGTLRLDPRVRTDLAVLVERLEQARQSSSAEALELLRDGLALVDGPAFDAAGYDWAHRDQDVAYASTAIEQAVETLVGLALESGLADVAREAITRGLRGLPGNEQLYRCRMRVEHHIGNHAAIVNAYNELTVYLADLDTEPAPATTALYHELSRRTRT